MFNDFKARFENDLGLKLNEQFISDYGIDMLGHDRLQGVKYNEEDIRRNDLVINYYDSSNQLITDNKQLKEYRWINIDVQAKDTNFVNDGNLQISLDTSNLPFGWTPIDPSVKVNNLNWLWILLGIVGAIGIISLIGFVIYKNKKSNLEN